MDTKRAILRTLFYSNLFEFPLTKAELWKYYCNTTAAWSFTRWQKALMQLTGPSITYHSPYFFLNGREKLRLLRFRRTKRSQQLLHANEQLFHVLGKLPTVRLLAVSGSLARLNADTMADIDLFVITTKGTLWSTRLFLLLLLSVGGKRRSFNQKQAKGAICLNMLLDETALALGSQRRDLFTAHEICQLRILVDKQQTYQRFLRANSWIRGMLPHAWQALVQGKRKEKTKIPVAAYCLQMCEPLLRWYQCRRIRKHQTTEVVRRNVAAFHPKDYKAAILAKMEDFQANSSLWDIDKAKQIIYTRSTISPVALTERFSFPSNYE